MNYSNMIYFFFIFCIALPQMFLDKSAVRELRETIRVCKAVILLKCILLYRADDADGAPEACQAQIYWYSDPLRSLC